MSNVRLRSRAAHQETPLGANDATPCAPLHDLLAPIYHNRSGHGHLAHGTKLDDPHPDLKKSSNAAGDDDRDHGVKTKMRNNQRTLRKPQTDLTAIGNQCRPQRGRIRRRRQIRYPCV